MTDELRPGNRVRVTRGYNDSGRTGVVRDASLSGKRYWVDFDEDCRPRGYSGWWFRRGSLVKLSPADQDQPTTEDQK